MEIKLSHPPVGTGMYDIQENVDNASVDVMAHIKLNGSINISEYNRACRHYRVNRESLFASTHPYCYWCMDCSLIVTYEDYNKYSAKCHSCTKKYNERMKGFVMQRSYSSPEKIKHTDCLITAMKIAGNYEADLYVDGKLVLCPLGWEHDYQAEVLEKYGVIQYYHNNRLQWKYADESKNSNKVWVDYHEYLWEGVKKVQFNVHDYQNVPNAQALDSLDGAKELALLLYPNNEIVLSNWLDNDYKSLKHIPSNGWSDYYAN